MNKLIIILLLIGFASFTPSCGAGGSQGCFSFRTSKGARAPSKNWKLSTLRPNKMGATRVVSLRARR